MTKKLSEMTYTELEAFHDEVLTQYEAYKAKGMKLDMSRGKPNSEQISVSNGLFSLPADGNYTMDNVDTRNYGVLDGLPSCKKYFADVLGTKPEEVFIGGCASLALMYDVISRAYLHGLLHSKTPWCKLEKVKWLCPAPGYDRHFKLSASFGMELITVPMLEDGPDMEMVEELVRDPDVRGMWCVPKYSNPDGIIYSDSVIKRIAALKPAAQDFLLMWDNAYCVHEFDGDFIPFLDILEECRKAGNPDMVFEFASTSKITFPGAGISCFAASQANLEYMKKFISYQIIGYDKINQLRHVLFLKDRAHTLEHMKKHAAFMKPKFDLVCERLEREILPLGIGTWHKPKGGYFVSFFTIKSCAKRTNQLAREAGITMTGAGATYPYGIDPDDSNLRIAPSYPPLNELSDAMDVFCVSVKLAAVEKLLADKKTGCS